jgi:DNA-binding ferritin-like protein
MVSKDPKDSLIALNEVLSEVIDLVQDVKQAHRQVPENHALHSELDRLFDDLRSWAQALIEEDTLLGVSPLSSMPSVAGRIPRNLWPSTPSDEEVRKIIAEHLERLSASLSAALEEHQEDSAEAVLQQMRDELTDHLKLLEAP